MFRCEQPNTCIIANGFAGMGIAVQGASAAKLARPEQAVVAVAGEAGFLMNAQEPQTAVRLGLALVILVWNGGGYGLIELKQMGAFGRPAYVRFGHPDLIRFAESFRARGYRVKNASALLPLLKPVLSQQAVRVIDCPVGYSENFKVTAKLGEMVCTL